MPTPEIDLDPFKAEMQNRIAAGESQKDVRRWLAAKGVQIHRNTLSTRLQEWQWTPTQVQVPSIDATLVAEVDSAFHTTHHDDQTIADNIAASGIPTTHRQVKRIRLTQGWRRRGNTDDQLADSRAKTFALVKSVLHQGVARCYGRGLLRTYLRVAHGHQARDDDVRDALSTLDTAGTESRRKGPNKSRQGGEYITPGPEALQSLGHEGDPAANEFLPQIRHFLVPSWYRQLRIMARNHIAGGEAPTLSLAPKPDTLREWQVKQQVLAGIRNEVDTFGLVEAGVEQEDGESATDQEWNY